MIKECKICGSEFEANAPNQKYCSAECRKERIREYDRQRKRKARKEAKKEKLIVLEQKRKEFEARELEYKKKVERERQLLEEKAKQGDPSAIMQIANNCSPEYWKAYQEYHIRESKQFKGKFVRYVNGISVFDDDFVDKVLITIEQYGRIFSELKDDTQQLK